MIAFQGFKKSKDSFFILLDTDGIEEMIGYLNFIKNQDSSIHLNEGNELINHHDMDDDMYFVPHIKIINIDKLNDL
jgi:hypothetical protein